MSYIIKSTKKRVVVRGTHNEQIPEIPLIALREVILNAIVHRDYSPLALGREIRIRLYPNRLEIESPGGLFAGSRIDTIKSNQSVTRNPFLATLLEDMQLMENRGDGIPATIQACKNSGVPEPSFYDQIDTFKVVFYREYNALKHDKQILDEFEQFARKDLISRGFSLSQAKKFIAKMLEEGKITKHGVGKGTYYLVK